MPANKYGPLVSSVPSINCRCLNQWVKLYKYLAEFQQNTPFYRKRDTLQYLQIFLDSTPLAFARLRKKMRGLRLESIAGYRLTNFGLQVKYGYYSMGVQGILCLALLTEAVVLT